MLVLSRKIGETVVIGGNIEVTITRVAGNRVTLGINAPSTVRVVRAELGRGEARESAAAQVDNVAAQGVAKESVMKVVGGDGASVTRDLGLKDHDAISAPLRMATTGEGPSPVLSTVS